MNSENILNKITIDKDSTDTSSSLVKTAYMSTMKYQQYQYLEHLLL